MKFAKKLQHQLDHTLPGWKNAFLNYKSLKKRLKANVSSLGSTAPLTFLKAAIQIRDENPSIENDFPETQEPSVGAGNEQDQSSSRHLTEEDENFLRLVKFELHKFNAFFLEKEEEFLIRLSIIEEKTDKVKEKRMQSVSGVCDRSTYEQLIELHRRIVTLHGEMVLLMNYSSLNYVGLLKILKKYDRHTKSNLRQLVHWSVLQQPFVSITNLKEMIAHSLACEDSLQSFLPTPGDVVEPTGAGLARDVSAEPFRSLNRSVLK